METIVTVTSGAGICLLAILGWQVFSLRRRLTVALGGANPESLESRLTNYFNQVKTTDEQHLQLRKEYERLSTMASLASQKISIVRFNPFGDTGGDQSFCLAVLDAYNSGYVLTSIHGRQGTRVYVKPIDYGKSKYNLSEEEQAAIKQAGQRVPSFKEQ